MTKTVWNYADDLPGVAAHSYAGKLEPGPDPDARDVPVYVDRNSSGYLTLRWDKADPESAVILTSKAQTEEVLALIQFLATRNAQVLDWTKPAEDWTRNAYVYDRPLTLDLRVLYRVTEVKAALGYDPETAVAALIATGDLEVPVTREYRLTRNLDPRIGNTPLSVASADYRVVRVKEGA